MPYATVVRGDSRGDHEANCSGMESGADTNPSSASERGSVEGVSDTYRKSAACTVDGDPGGGITANLSNTFGFVAGRAVKMVNDGVCNGGDSSVEGKKKKATRHLLSGVLYLEQHGQRHADWSHTCPVRDTVTKSGRAKQERQTRALHQSDSASLVAMLGPNDGDQVVHVLLMAQVQKSNELPKCTHTGGGA